jgi:hypothetical protein
MTGVSQLNLKLKTMRWGWESSGCTIASDECKKLGSQRTNRAKGMDLLALLWVTLAVPYVSSFFGSMKQTWTRQLNRSPDVSAAISTRMNAVKQIAVVVLSLFVVTAWFTAILYFSFTMEF